MYLGHVKVLLGMFLSLKTLYRKRTVIWPFYFYTIIRTLSINKFENIVSNEFVFYNASKITINDLSIKLKSAMANDQGITKHDIGLAERAVYKVYFKNGSSKYVDLKTEYKDERVFKATDIKKVDIELKF
ncbi:truncated map-w protein; extracellular adherence protein of broad specificity Eap/Map [Staphylococcus aureus]|nr:truncated map-w protein; extracellular adherence protein of broad specificity Eap/Map [Staphylococcus aureus]CAC6733330.1 truncated map-w protein; extracellular adherence protein of broad specificity Eap/Map [Staphylococcus aureus]CAC7254533.1 truncated map-w protein; extracellular adherence protein of broad specificity Eap/Map [Staphylococcus aureus]CAC7587921.1 truncated map-w protein; extracellular adherence protein of broad specificity Eap/Map [Staphylococcus aureus]CAC7633873.1 truncate